MTGNKINFGIGGKFGQINPRDFKAGIRQGWQRIANDNIDTIFDKLDQNKNGILEQTELDTLLQQLGKYSKDSKITQREAKKILEGLDLKNIDEKVLFKLLEQMNKESKGISSSSDTNNDGLIDSITYNKNERGTVRTLNFDEQGNLTSSIYQQGDSEEVYDANGNLLKEETVDESGQKVTKEYTYDNAGNKIGEKISASDGSVTEIKYGADGKKIEEKTTKDSTTTTIKYNATTGEQESKTVQKGAVTEHYDENNKLTKKETDKGQGLKETIEYEYNENGECVKETKTSPDGIKTIKEGDKVTVIQTDGSKEVTENGKTQKYDKDGNLINENQQSVNNAFKNGVAKVKIEGKATGLTSNDYEGELRLPKGATVQDGSYPQELRMTLPSGYGENATMKLKLIDAENGIYSTSTGDRNFQLVADENGNISVKAVNVEELQSKLDANLETYRKIAEEKQAALEESQIKDLTISQQEEILSKAKADFEAQLASDGWAGKTADAISILWGSENRATKVQEDIDVYSQQLQELKDAKAQGEEQFKQKFKEIFGVDYNSDNIKAYIENPNDETYAKAYGTTNDIAQRVAKYNESQQKGASAVKTSVVIAGSVAAGIATGGASIAATAAIAGASTAALRMATEVSDLATNDVKGDITGQKLDEIAMQAAIEGAISGVTAGVVKGTGSLMGKAAQTATKSATSSVTSSAVAKTTSNATSGAVAKAATNTASNTAGRAASGAASNAAGAAGKTAGSAASNAAGAAGRTAGKAAGTVIKEALDDISSRIAKDGLKSLTPKDLSQLSKILKVEPSQIQSLSRKQVLQLLKQFHPDKCGLEYANQITSILNALLKNAV